MEDIKPISNFYGEMKIRMQGCFKIFIDIGPLGQPNFQLKAQNQLFLDISPKIEKCCLSSSRKQIKVVVVKNSEIEITDVFIFKFFVNFSLSRNCCK